MALMHFFVQLGMLRVGPVVVMMPDDIENVDREALTAEFMKWQTRPDEFYKRFTGLTDAQVGEIVRHAAEVHMDQQYPEPSSNIVSSFHASTFEHKDYYLPALKVLNYRDGKFYSPARTVEWKNQELKATHIEVDETRYGDKVEYNVTKSVHAFKVDCDCGIYGSVNMEELNIYMFTVGNRSMVMLDPTFDVSERKLCIIEPANNSDVFLARKGWRASKAFISEIIGETISFKDASELLSMVWNRRIDVQSIFRDKERAE